MNPTKNSSFDQGPLEKEVHKARKWPGALALWQTIKQMKITTWSSGHDCALVPRPRLSSSYKEKTQQAKRQRDHEKIANGSKKEKVKWATTWSVISPVASLQTKEYTSVNDPRALSFPIDWLLIEAAEREWQPERWGRTWGSRLHLPVKKSLSWAINRLFFKKLLWFFAEFSEVWVLFGNFFGQPMSKF